ncbi:Crp/Fnr family transcriptional regulator [Paucilactobacillus sp. N302-9]
MTLSYAELLRDILTENKKILSEIEYSNNFSIYSPQDTIVEQQEEIKYFYLLLDGSASVWNKISWEEGQKVGQVFPLEILGLIEHLNGINFYTADVIAESKCLIFKTPVDKFISTITQNGDLCLLTLQRFANTVSLNMTNAEKKTLFEGEDILGHFLYLEAKEHLPYVCPLTRQQLSEKLEINLRTLYRYISTLQHHNYLQLQHGKLIVDRSEFYLLQKRYQEIIF